MIPTLEEWHAAGRRITLRGTPHSLFCRAAGDGPWVTLLHGFPSSSWDWSKVSPALERRKRVLAFDFLGFGNSDKPADHRYSIHEQADLVEALWAHSGVDETAILAHDYGDAVTMELLARLGEGKLSARITSVVLLNGSVYAQFNQLLFIQTLLRQPIVGSVVSQLVTEKLFLKNFRRVFAPEHAPTEDEFHSHWKAIELHRGNQIYHRLVHHYDDHDRHGARWHAALESTQVPLTFIWGMDDPVSTSKMFEHMRARVPGAAAKELAGVRHYPHLEVPDLVSAEALRSFGA